VACFLLYNLPHSFFLKSYFISTTSYTEQFISLPFAPQLTLGLSGDLMKRLYDSLFPAINDGAIKDIVSSSKACFSDTLRLSVLQHYSLLRENKYCTISLI